PDEEPFGVVAELHGEPLADSRRPRIVAVRAGGTGVGLGDRLQHGRMDRCGVVAPEFAGEAHSLSLTLSSQRAITLPSGSATIAIIPNPCCTGSVRKAMPCSCSAARVATRSSTRKVNPVSRPTIALAPAWAAGWTPRNGGPSPNWKPKLPLSA